MTDNIFDSPNKPGLFDGSYETQEKSEQIMQSNSKLQGKFNIGKDRDRNELYALLKLKALSQNPEAIAKEDKTFYTLPPKDRGSNIVRDSEGRVAGTKESVLNGRKATARNQAELIRALREDIYKDHGIDS